MADDSIKRIIELGMNAGPAIAEAQKLGKAMEDNTQSINGMQQGLAQLASSAVDVFQGLAVMDLAKQFVDNVQQMIESMDQLGKAAQVTGVSVEKLQELQYALKLGAGLDDGQATAALTRFADKLADVNNKTSDAARVMRDMGITIDDTVDSALEKLSQRFADAPDGINKTAVATEIFGRSLAIKMIPFLNSGADGLADMRKELGELGGTYDSVTADQAAKFDDNLTKLAQHSKALGVTITADLLPPLVELSGKFVQAAKDGNLLSTALQRYWENVQDFWTKTGRAIGIGSDATNAESRATADSFNDLAKSMDAMRAASARAASTEPLPPAHVEKVKAAGKAAAQAASDFEKWMDAMLKVAQADTDLPAKIDWLTRGLANLAASGDTSSETWKKWNAELLKLRPDAVASELLKLADAAKKADEATSGAMLEGLTAQLQKLEAAGPGATTQVKLLHDQILKIQADGGDAIAQVTLELEKLQKQTQQNNADWEVTEQLFAKGAISLQEYSELAAKYYPAASKAVDEHKEKVKDLSESIKEASANFVTNWVDTMIDGFGKTKASFADMVTDMIKMIAKLIVQFEVANAVKAMGFGSSTASGTGGAFATGGAWNASGVQMMATGGILSSPTFFSTGGRLAVAGEAGAEAVVPLQYGASGNLGVGASPTTVNVYNNADAKVTTATKDNDDGSKQIDIYVERKVKDMMSNGSMDKTMRSVYGVSRQPAAG